jgi:hypothetical protein
MDVAAALKHNNSGMNPSGSDKKKMTLEENIQQLRDSLTVTSAQTLRH